MKTALQTGMIGCAFHTPRYHDTASLEEALHQVTRNALLDAGLDIADIDGIVVAANDQYDGRAIAIMAASGSVGGVGRDILSTPSCAEHAFVLGSLRVASGQFRTQLIVSWSPLETAALNDAQRLGTDPYFHRQLPLDDLSSHGLQANALEARVPGIRDAAIAIAESNRKHAAIAYPEFSAHPVEPEIIASGRVVRWPLTEGMVSKPAFAAVALVLASDEFIAERNIANPAWIQGIGWATEPGFLGDRDLADLPSLRSAARQAYEAAGIKDAATSFDLAEVADATPYQELIALEALGLCEAEQWSARIGRGDFKRGGALPVNLSGGALSFNPVFCTGLLRIAEAANQVRGCAGRHQADRANKALAHGASGFAMQYNTVVVFGRDPKEAQQ
ncbi:thiolase family protein [Bordetella sp. BOR01]|uniref:thiolase family protein n=1 Tax=Bordetella sp. BOR01 TaxID=2854779 RepID=UPI001C483156|nr:thiolase family protein [Bordetella sp. BOR01]MBV7483222.1 thiolase family protein [Bordetella sp. BOR01]